MGPPPLLVTGESPIPDPSKFWVAGVHRAYRAVPAANFERRVIHEWTYRAGFIEKFPAKDPKASTVGFRLNLDLVQSVGWCCCSVFCASVGLFYLFLISFSVFWVIVMYLSVFINNFLPWRGRRGQMVLQVVKRTKKDLRLQGYFLSFVIVDSILVFSHLHNFMVVISLYILGIINCYAATPHHDGMRTPMHDRAWNPYTPMSPPRIQYEMLLKILSPGHSVKSYP